MAMFPPPRGFGIKPPRAPRLAAPKIRAPKVAPPTDLQTARQQVSQAYDPILNQIRAAYAGQATAAGNAINAGAKQLADLYGSYGPSSQAAYDRAAQGMAAVNGMLAGVQAGQGTAQEADLAHQLQGIDSGTVGRVSGNLASALQGESLANATKGSNNLAMLLGEGAHAGQFGAILPGVAGGIGFNALRGQENTINAAMADELNKLAAQEPGAVQDALANIQSNRSRSQQLAFENSLKNAEFGLASQKAKTSAAQGQQRLTIEQQRAATASQQGWARIGLSQQRLQLDQQKAARVRKAGGITPGQMATIQAKAEHDAETLYYGVPAKTRADGSTVTPAVNADTYGQAYKTLLARYPSLGPTATLRILNTLYAPGEGGRPAGKGIHFVNGNPVFGR